MRIDGHKFEYNGETFELRCSHYVNNRLAIRVLSNGEPYTVLTVNIPAFGLGKKEIIVKTWSENKDICKIVLNNTNLFEDTDIQIPTGFCEASVWKFAKDVEP